MAYTAEKSQPRESSDELRARIPGWGADLDAKDRPAFPREVFDPAASGAHWTFPERQPEKRPRERSIEHKFLTPVFGTAQPLKGLSGAIRKYAYARYSEGRAAHWLLLMAADRVDVAESRVSAIVQLKPDNPVTETGVLGEFRRGGIASRFGRNRTDVHHTWMDPLLIAAPYLLAGWAAVRTVRRLRRG